MTASLYKLEYCDELETLMANGLSVSEVCKKWWVGRRTFYEWLERYAEFRDAYERAKTFNLGWWEENGRENLTTKNHNPVSWLIQIRNRHPDCYTENGRFVKLKLLEDAKTYTEQAQAVRTSVARGIITCAEAEKISNMLVANAKVEEITELRERLDKIEDSINAGQS